MTGPYCLYVFHSKVGGLETAGFLVGADTLV